jgi:hypothetical protein
VALSSNPKNTKNKKGTCSINLQHLDISQEERASKENREGVANEVRR